VDYAKDMLFFQLLNVVNALKNVACLIKSLATVFSQIVAITIFIIEVYEVYRQI